jgi:hippurate hydrolase
MLDEGLLDVPTDGGFGPVSGAFAIHITARYSTGTLNFRPGALYAAGDRFAITVRGAGGHASSPHLALDPVPIAAEIVLALQTIRSRRINTFDPMVLTIGSLTAGTAANIIPETAVLHGTVRTTSSEVRDRAHELIRQIPTGIAAAHGASGRGRDLERLPGDDQRRRGRGAGDVGRDRAVRGGARRRDAVAVDGQRGLLVHPPARCPAR